MKIVFTLILGVIGLNTIAQEDVKPTLIGDRPDQTESAFLLPVGYFQFEDGFVFENQDLNTQNYTYSSMLLRYGLFKNFELRFATSYNTTKIIGFDDIKGFAPAVIGAKIHVHEEKGWLPQIAFLGHIQIAETGSKDLKQNYHSTKLVMTFNHSISDFWSLGYSLGVGFPSDIDYSVGTYTLVNGFSISEKIGAFIELYGDFSKYMYAQNKINGGVTFLISPNFQLDIAGGFGLSEYAPDNYIGVGFIYLFKPF